MYGDSIPAASVGFSGHSDKVTLWRLAVGSISSSIDSLPIVPAVLSDFFFQNWRKRLLFGWGVGFILCVLGMMLSYSLDVPAGALIVVLFTAVPIVGVIIAAIFRRANA